MIHVGCCGFPKGMRRYFDDFEVVEVQSTFYKLPRIETARRWRETAPKGFEFALKAWQLITHHPQSPTYRKAKIDIPVKERSKYGSFKPTEGVFDAWERTREICEALGSKIAVFQCPATFKPIHENIENMVAFFNSIERKNLNFAWEPRSKEWPDSKIEELCEDLDLIHCVDPFARDPVCIGDIVYLRLHGFPPGKRMYMYKYRMGDLRELSEKCASFDKAGVVYCLFNNVSMYEDAKRFREML
ncbi:MAG: DUF72 domain-containing protein [Candidatus Hydrothermarchaeales archaeon]